MPGTRIGSLPGFAGFVEPLFEASSLVAARSSTVAMTTAREKDSVRPHLIETQAPVARLLRGTFEYKKRRIMKSFERITIDPAVMGGKACVRGLRVTVGTVVGLLAAGRTRDEILKAYPYLEQEDIDQSLAYAASRLADTAKP